MLVTPANLIWSIASTNNPDLDLWSAWIITDPSGYSIFNLSMFALTAFKSTRLLSIQISSFSVIATNIFPFSSLSAVSAFGLLTSTPVYLTNDVVTMKNMSMIKTMSIIGVKSSAASSWAFLLLLYLLISLIFLLNRYGLLLDIFLLCLLNQI